MSIRAILALILIVAAGMFISAVAFILMRAATIVFALVLIGIVIACLIASCFKPRSPS